MHTRCLSPRSQPSCYNGAGKQSWHRAAISTTPDDGPRPPGEHTPGFDWPCCDEAAEINTTLPIGSQGSVGRFNPLYVNQILPPEMSFYVCLTALPGANSSSYTNYLICAGVFFFFFFNHSFMTYQQGKTQAVLHLQTPSSPCRLLPPGSACFSTRS